MGAMTFMMSHNALTQFMYTGQKNTWYSNLDFKTKNFIIFMVSDALASIAKLPFETRK
jgi:hypothetical protein